MIENDTTTAVGSLSEVLRHLADAFDAAMPEPSGMSYSTYEERSPIVGLTFKPEGAACVETWAAKYGSRYGRSDRQLFNDGTQWMTSDTVEVLGVTVQLTGYDPVEPEVLVGEVTSPFGLCSGLALDSRDNTCTRFAAEYVESGDGMYGTLLRRLCVPCADAAPNVRSRRPLTMAPGGVPVERADAAVLVAEAMAEPKALDLSRRWRDESGVMWKPCPHDPSQVMYAEREDGDTRFGVDLTDAIELYGLVEVTAQPTAEAVQP